ncbi:MAG: hypothetical protein JXB00_15435 [Bacteroidales bacterium]|nr:hypothetical protein [Bacteroidales bacterium]
MKKVLFSILAAVTIILLCSMAWVRLNILQPALITLPEHIRSIAVIDRTLKDPTSQTKTEQILTGEMFKQDEQALKRAIDGTLEVCAEFNMFQIIRSAERMKGGGTKTTFPAPLPWNQVSDLCTKHQADAILSIEIFDSDFIIANPVNLALQVLEGNALKGGGFRVTAVAVINYGVRLYDPVNKRILDEYQVAHRLNFEGSGSSAQDAMNHLLNKMEAINQTSYGAGKVYGERISPSYYRVTREFYNKPKRDNNLRAGVRKSEVADWNGAIESWTKALNGKRKAARRAAFNIAVAYEVLGDLEKAKEWAAKSYTEYGEKRGNDYYKIIAYRIREEAVIKRQVPQE